MRVDSLLRNPGRRTLLCGVLAMVLARSVPAQTSTGSIRGYVTDSSGAPIAGARVIAVNSQTSAQREAATENNGFYAILGLVPAEYDVTARQIGRAPQKVHVQVLIGEVFPLDFRLAASASRHARPRSRPTSRRHRSTTSPAQVETFWISRP